jgi:citrate synthase
MEPISRIDPISNQLFFRGHSVTDLCVNPSFESVLYLLINGCVPRLSEQEKFTEKIINLRRYYTEEYSTLNDVASNLNHLLEEEQLNFQDTLLTFVAVAPLVAAKHICRLENKKVKKPNNELKHVANFIWMIRGGPVNDIDVKDAETSLILHMDDPSNPSLTALHSSIKNGKTLSEALLDALAVHVDPLHHGAGTEAMHMIEEIRYVKDLDDYLRHRIEAGKKIYGLGHRIYRGTDPRAIVLRKILERRTMNTSNGWILETIDRVTEDGYSALKNLKNVEAYPNVDLYNAAIYYSLGVPPVFNTELFAISRAAGWIAHILEWNSEKENH